MSENILIKIFIFLINKKMRYPFVYLFSTILFTSCIGSDKLVNKDIEPIGGSDSPIFDELKSSRIICIANLVV